MITADTVGEWNDRFRFHLGILLTGADKQALADLLGVSVRTVQRWTCNPCEEMRFPFTRALAGYEVNELPEPWRGRLTALTLLTRPISRQFPESANKETVLAYSNAGDLVADLSTWNDGEDAWRAQKISYVLTTPGGPGWVAVTRWGIIYKSGILYPNGYLVTEEAGEEYVFQAVTGGDADGQLADALGDEE